MRRSTLWFGTVFLLFASTVYSQVLTLTPSLSVGERYDDNIFQEETDEVDDFVTVITPRIQLHYMPSSSTNLDLNYEPSFQIFAENTDQNHIAQRFSLRLAAPVSRLLSVNVRDDFLVTEEPGDRIIEIDQVTGLRRASREQRSRTIRNFATAALQAQVASRVTLGVLFNSLIEDVDIADEVDEFRYTAGAEVGYIVNVPRNSRLFLSSDVTFHNFRANDPTVRDEEDFRVYTVNVGFEHTFNPKWSGRFTVGYALTGSDDPNLDENDAIVGSARIVRTLRDGELSFTYRRHLTSGGGEGEQVTADTLVAAFVSQISPRVRLGLGANLSFFDFEQAIDDRTFFTVRPTLVYQILRFWAISVAYDYLITNFDEPIRADETEHRVRISSRFTLRAGLFLELAYRYSERNFDSGIVRFDEFEFVRNEVMLTLAYGPTLRF